MHCSTVWKDCHSVSGLRLSLYITPSHIQSDMLKKSSLKLHFLFLSFFHSFFFFVFVFLFFDNWEC